ncbi:MAG: MerR family DNA-binding transcriptional regulator [Gammaproteobacteria bacterium]|nr:MerR family DNA-binding transcriptional regulator [Gammaproteobacteria bacterium]MCP4983808.1 MerR family DNA-binding transcriptional regulator [Gammaproteobacteria bacterium]
MNQPEINNKTYAIGELAAEFGVTSRALRLYEEEGLLDPQREGTRRIYNDRNRVRLRLILRGKRLGWSLSEIRESFDLYDSSLGEEAQLEWMLDKLTQRRDSLISQKKDIDNALEELERIAVNAEQALHTLQAEQPKTGHG